MIPFSIIVAVDSRYGIGKSGQLPWRLAGDMKHFKETTIKTADAAKQNAVIMGRKTWDSIPEKFRPLPQRLNVVVTRNQALTFCDGVIKSDSVENALHIVEKNQHSLNIESVFIIGGGEIYNQALALPNCKKIYLTSISHNFQCDTFLPQLSNFKKVSESSCMREGNLSFQFLELLRA